ncbi:MAG: hypothetical protein KKG99_05420 [Bacteroidetes bacterium]|nr:hypothetical protein [Bacteroidota bacterium]
MKTINIRTILKITLIFICASFYPINNQAGESISEIEHKSQFVKRVKDSQRIAKDTSCLMKWYDNLSDTINVLIKSSSSSIGNESLLLTEMAKDKNIVSEKATTETKPRKLAYVFIDVLIKSFSLMLNK